MDEVAVRFGYLPGVQLLLGRLAAAERLGQPPDRFLITAAQTVLHGEAGADNSQNHLVAAVKGVLTPNNAAHIVIALPELPDGPEVGELAGRVVGDEGRVLVGVKHDVPLRHGQVALILTALIAGQVGGFRGKLTLYGRHIGQNLALNRGSHQRHQQPEQHNQKGQAKGAAPPSPALPARLRHRRHSRPWRRGPGLVCSTQSQYKRQIRRSECGAGWQKI